MHRKRSCAKCGNPTTGKFCTKCYHSRGRTATPKACDKCGDPTGGRYAKFCAKCYRARGKTATTEGPLCRLCQQQHVHKRSLNGQVCAQCWTTRRPECLALMAAGSGDGAGPDHARDVMVDRLAREAKMYRTAYRETVKDAAEEERLIDMFKSSLARFPAMPAAHFRIKRDETHGAGGQEVPALLLGDQHIGEEISIEETFGINRYNFAVFQSRIEHLEDRVVDILTNHQRAPFSEMVVFLMGDNISGVIHEELQKHGHQHIIDQVYLGALSTALFLYRLLARLRPRGVQRLRVSCVSGNHGRTSKDKESKRYYKNFDYLFHGVVAQALADVPQIEFHIPRCLFTVVDVAGIRILQSHGHELPPSSLGIPLYSINRASAGYQELLAWTEASRFDYWLLGHFHRPMELDSAIVNGTMAGLSELGIGRYKPVRPMQKLIGFHEKWGKAWEYPVRLDHSPPAASIYTFESDMAIPDALGLFASQRAAAVGA